MDFHLGQNSAISVLQVSQLKDPGIQQIVTNYGDKNGAVEAVPQQDEQTLKKDTEKAIDTLNRMLAPHHTMLHFVLHDKLNEYYVQVVDTDTGDVIREIPPKKFLDMYAATLEFIGFLVDKKV